MTGVKKRTLRIALEALVGLMLGSVILASVGIYVLSRGPISLSSLTPTIERMLNSEDAPYRVTLEDTRIVWGGWDRAVDVIAGNVTVQSEGAPPIAVLEEVSVGLSFRDLLKGELRLRALEVFAPTITLVRDPDGSIALAIDTAEGFSELADDADIDPDDNWVSVPRQQESGLLPRNLIDALTAGVNDNSALSSLQQFSVLNAEIRILDRSLGETLWLHSTDLDFTRSDRGLSTRLSGTLETRRDTTPVTASLDVTPEDEQIDFQIGIVGLNTDLPIRYFPDLAFYLPDLTVGGSLAATLDLDGQLQHVDLALASAAGSINLQADIPQSLPAMKVFASFDALDTAQWLAGLYEAGPVLEYLPTVPITGTVTASINDTGYPTEIMADLSSDIGSIVLNAIRDSSSAIFAGDVSFKDINPYLISQSAPSLSALSALNASVNGWAEFALDQNWNPVSGRLDAKVGTGTLTVPGIIETLPSVTAGSIAARMEPDNGPFVIESLSLAFGKPSVSLSGSLQLGEAASVIDVNGMVLDLPMNQLSLFWPEALAADAREWVIGNIPEADVHQAGIAATFTLPDNDPDQLQINALSGGIKFDQAEVHYLRPLTPVTGVSGFASYTASDFNIDVFSGQLEDAQLKSGRINIAGLDISNETIDIDISLATPLPTALKLLDTEPRRYIQKIGLDADGITGFANANVHFEFPLLADLKDDQIVYGADATFTDITVPRADINAVVTAETTKFDLVPGQMSIVGDMKIDGTPAQVVWTENFAEGSRQPRSMSVNTIADIKETQRFGVNLAGLAEGRAGMKLNYITFDTGAQSIALSANLKEATLTADAVGWQKDSGVPSDLSMQLIIQPDGHLNFETFTLDGRDDHYLEGTFAATPGFADLISARFDGIRLGKTDISAEVDKVDGIYKIDLHGPVLDVAPFLHDDDDDQEEGPPDPNIPVATEPRLRIQGEVGELIDGADRRVQEALFALNLNGERTDLLTLQGIVGDGRTVDVNYTPTVNGGHQLFVLAEDTGMALAAADLTGRLEGGTLMIEGLSTARDAPLNGKISITDFQIKEAPALARLLEVISVTGILSALSNEGLPFNTLTADFNATDSVITITNGAARSSSIGISFQGTVDRYSDKLNINGDIAVSDIFSRTIGQLPIIDLLVGDGLIGATYQMTGSTSDPDVSVNPLSVIAPGFLRKVFGASSPKVPEESSDSPSATPPDQTAPIVPDPDRNSRGN